MEPFEVTEDLSIQAMTNHQQIIINLQKHVLAAQQAVDETERGIAGLLPERMSAYADLIIAYAELWKD